MGRISKQEGKEGDLDRWYFAAAGRWPSLKWSKYLYQTHLAIVREDVVLHPEEVFLAGAAAFGISDAWSLIYEEYSSEVISSLRNLLVPGHEPYDLWACALERLVGEIPDFPTDAFEEHEECVLPPRRIVNFRGDSTLKSYILTVARNRGIEHLRKKALKYESVDVSHVSGQNTDTSRSGDSQLNEAEAKQVQSLMKRGLDSLPSQDQELLMALCLDGVSGKEASQILGYSEGTATRRRQSAVGSIQQLLSSIEFDEEEINNSVRESFARYFKRLLQFLRDDSST